MATKIAIKNQIPTSFGGIYYMEDEYTRLFAEPIDHVLGLRSRFLGESVQRNTLFVNHGLLLWGRPS